MNQTNLYKKSSGEPLCSKKDRLEMLFSMIKKNTSLPYFNPEELFVPGVGNLDAKILVIGEAPGAEESIQGKPFVGRSGQLLSKLLDESEIDRTELYITNVVKYRPPNNKTPEYKECMQWFTACLQEEIAIIDPKIIVTVGASATKVFLGEKISISSAEGKIHKIGGTTLVPTFHPAYLLRNRSKIPQMLKTLELIKSYEQNC
jgi:uracil-DNA glycosylase family 4